jgi:hypothetical protein
MRKSILPVYTVPQLDIALFAWAPHTKYDFTIVNMQNTRFYEDQVQHYAVYIYAHNTINPRHFVHQNYRMIFTI